MSRTPLIWSEIFITRKERGPPLLSTEPSGGWEEKNFPTPTISSKRFFLATLLFLLHSFFSAFVGAGVGRRTSIGAPPVHFDKGSTLSIPAPMKLKRTFKKLNILRQTHLYSIFISNSDIGSFI
ncbi:hypothetical protein V6N13_103839 [Hibiscus sabdariffa]